TRRLVAEGLTARVQRGRGDGCRAELTTALALCDGARGGHRRRAPPRGGLARDPRPACSHHTVAVSLQPAELRETLVRAVPVSPCCTAPCSVDRRRAGGTDFADTHRLREAQRLSSHRRKDPHAPTHP